METLERILQEHSFARGLEDRYVQLLVGCASNVRFDPGQIIFREGEEAKQFYLVREGRQYVYAPSADQNLVATDEIVPALLGGESGVAQRLQVGLLELRRSRVPDGRDSDRAEPDQLGQVHLRLSHCGVELLGIVLGCADEELRGSRSRRRRRGADKRADDECQEPSHRVLPERRSGGPGA